jgi:hypothetical protein
VTVTGFGGSDLGTAAYTRSGTELATGSLRGLLLVSNAGGILRKLPVPGEKNGCSRDHQFGVIAVAPYFVTGKF